jgi:hypothetical protein
MTNNSILLVDCHNGVYIPKRFNDDWSAFLVNRASLDKYLVDLSDVDNEYYWDSWDLILGEAKLELRGRIYRLHEDGDLWAVPEAELLNIDGYED